MLMTGYHVGAVATALLGILLIPRYGWQSMFVIGALPALVLVPLLWKLPARVRRRSCGPAPAWTRRRRGRPQAQQEPGRHPVPPRPGPVHHRVLDHLVHGPAAGLRPEHLAARRSCAAAGYELGAALALLLVLNVGAVIGLLVAGRVADRIGNRRSTIGWFAGAALFLALLSIRLPGIGVYVSVLLAGMFVFSAQVLVYAYISHLYPAAARATAVGAAERRRPPRRHLRPADRRLAAHRRPGLPVGLLHLRRRRRARRRCRSAFVNRDPAPDEPLPVTEDEADHIGERGTGRPRH